MLTCNYEIMELLLFIFFISVAETSFHSFHCGVGGGDKNL